MGVYGNYGQPESTGLFVRSQRLPYRWGRFQGIASLVTGVGVLLYTILTFTSGKTGANPVVAGLAITSPLQIVGGYAFYFRRKFAVGITYIWMGLALGTYLASMVMRPAGIGAAASPMPSDLGSPLAMLLTRLSLWGLCWRYYSRRRSELT